MRKGIHFEQKGQYYLGDNTALFSLDRVFKSRYTFNN